MSEMIYWTTKSHLATFLITQNISVFVVSTFDTVMDKIGPQTSKGFHSDGNINWRFRGEGN